MAKSKTYLVVGIDSGKTTGVAVLNFNGGLLDLFGSKNMGVSEAVKHITRFGTASVIACDVTPAPQFVNELSAKAGAVVFKSYTPLSIREKKELTKDFMFEDFYQRNSLAAALNVFNKFKNKFMEIDGMNFDELGLSEDKKEEVKHRVIHGNSIDSAIKDLMEGEGGDERIGEERLEKVVEGKPEEVIEEKPEKVVEKKKKPKTAAKPEITSSSPALKTKKLKVPVRGGEVVEEKKRLEEEQISGVKVEKTELGNDIFINIKAIRNIENCVVEDSVPLKKVDIEVEGAEKIEEEGKTIIRWYVGNIEKGNEITLEYKVYKETKSGIKYGTILTKEEISPVKVTGKETGEVEEMPEEVVEKKLEEERMKAEKDELVKELEKKTKDVGKLQEGLNKKNAAIEKLSVEREEVVESFENKIKELQQKLDEKTKERGVVFEEKDKLAGNLEEKIDNLEGEIGKLQEELNKKEAAIKKLSVEREEVVESFENKIKELQQKLDEKTKERGVVSEEKDKLAGNLEEKIDNLEVDIKKLQDGLNKKEAAIEKLSVEREEVVESFENKIKELQQKLDEKTKERGVVSEEKDKLVGNLEEKIEGLEKNLKESAGYLENVTKERDIDVQQLNETKKAIEEREDRLSILAKEKEEVVKSLNNKISELEIANEKTGDEIKSMKEQIDESDNEMKKRIREYDDIKGKYEEDEIKLEEVRTLLIYLDTLLEKLPVEEIEEFSKSEKFEMYERVFKTLNLYKGE